MGKPQGPIKAKPAWDKRAAIEKSRTKHLNQLSKLKKLRARLEAQGRAKPLEIKDNVEALERELLGSNSQAPQQQQQQQQKDGTGGLPQQTHNLPHSAPAPQQPPRFVAPFGGAAPNIGSSALLPKTGHASSTSAAAAPLPPSRPLPAPFGSTEYSALLQQRRAQQQQQQQQGWLRRSASGLEGIHQIDGVHHGGGSSSRGGRRLARMFGQGEEGQSDKEPIRRQPKLYLFSGHDSTITPVMAALGAPLSSWPPFVSNVVLELWGSKGKGDGDNKGDDLEVRVLFDQQPLHLRGGQKGGWISLADLEAQLKPYSATMQHHKAECGIVP
mmetsp:Transcript_26990/g.69538  ORF Transcript_26990/g.69538 Transcript_26990/m.69538 type:complete len:328 (+) Transcript_26990:90-1073(+)